MSEENAAVAEPVDDATIVNDEINEEQTNDKLVADVAKMLGRDETGEITGAPEKPADEPPAEEPQREIPALSEELQARAEGAGLTKELAHSLHQSGQLEETLAAFDRKMIERFQSRETEQPKEKPARQEHSPPEEPKAKDYEEVPDLDPETYDEALVKRDAYHKRRIDALEAKVAELLEDRKTDFDSRFDGMIDGLDCEELFGKGENVPPDKQANRDKLFKAYKAVCQMHDVDPRRCDVKWGKRALAAMFPEEVFTNAQKRTVARLRDAEGKFLHSSNTGGGPPAKAMTDAESHSQLVSKVASYLKKQGVQMSGV